MPDALVLLIGLVLAGAFVLVPLWRSRPAAEADADELEAAALRHRVALEALRDVETDRRAGSLDEAAYAAQLADAEERAAVTRAGLEARRSERIEASQTRDRRPAIVAAGIIGALLLAGSLVPATGIANETVVNEALARAEAAERERQARIAELRQALAANPEDAENVSALADAHLAGSTRDDLARAAAALQLLIALEPGRADAYERIMAAYLRAGDHANARAAHTSYAVLASADAAEIAFFDGLIALRGESDAAAAAAAFDRFLELAPDDPRAPMVRGLRDEAVGD
jgi:tetratricopeptide (TPR) repeat protein